MKNDRSTGKFTAAIALSAAESCEECARLMQGMARAEMLQAAESYRNVARRYAQSGRF